VKETLSRAVKYCVLFEVVHLSTLSANSKVRPVFYSITNGKKNGEERNREEGEMAKKVGRREKSGRKCREESEDKTLRVGRDG